MNFSIAGWEEEYLKMCEAAWDRIRDAEIAEALDEIRQQVRDMESADIEAEEVRCLMLALALERTAPDWN
jgi:hypothetical protein